MTTHRWPAVLVLAAIFVSALAYERGEGPPGGPEHTVQERLALERAVPHVDDHSGAQERWYCPGAGAGGAAPARTDLILTNTTGRDMHVHVSAMTQADNVPVQERRRLDLEPRTTEVLPLGELLEGPSVGATVESSAPGLLAEVRLRSDVGVAVGACATSTGTSWTFAAGTTTRDARYDLSILNPFPDDAVLDVTIETDEGTRVPTALQGVVVAGRSNLGIDLTEEAQRREHIAVHVEARAGRVAVARVQVVDGSLEARGLSHALGATGSALTWVFPFRSGGEDPPARYAVLNRADLGAEVDVELRPDDPERLFDIEPFALSVQSRRFAVVDLRADADRVVEDLLFAALVLGRNQVPVVAEQWITGEEFVSITPGIAVQATRWTVPHVPAAATSLGVMNVAASGIALLDVQALGPAGWEPVSGLQQLEVAPGRRILLRDEDLPAAALRLRSTAPVVVGRRVQVDASVSLLAALPSRGSSSRPDPFGLLEAEQS